MLGLMQSGQIASPYFQIQLIWKFSLISIGEMNMRSEIYTRPMPPVRACGIATVIVHLSLMEVLSSPALPEDMSVRLAD